MNYYHYFIINNSENGIFLHSSKFKWFEKENLLSNFWLFLIGPKIIYDYDVVNLLTVIIKIKNSTQLSKNINYQYF